MNNIEFLAIQANVAMNAPNHSFASDCLGALYDEVQKNSSRLINLPLSSCQSVGLAFTGMALLYNWNDEDINSVAAENAFYCLAKAFIHDDDLRSLPAIFTILQRRPHLLKDQFVAYWSDKAQKDIGLPIGAVLGGNPFTSPFLEEFRQQALSQKVYVQQYALSRFFNEGTNSFQISTNQPCFLPTIAEISSFKRNRADFDDATDDIKCATTFTQIFKGCEDSLLRMA